MESTAHGGHRTVARKHVLVTGGAGFIGSHLVDALLADGAQSVTVLDNFFLGTDENLAAAREDATDLRVLRADAADESQLRAALGADHFQVVFDLAVIPLPTSLERPKFCFDTNVAITSTLCELLREEAFETLVHFSSSEAYGSARYAPMGEDHPLDPLTPYAASKAASDHLVRTYAATFGVDALVVRPFNNYGPRQNDRQYAGIIPTLLRALYAGEPFSLFGDGEQTRDYIYVTDTVQAALALYAEPAARGKVVNVGSGSEISMLELIARLERIVGRPIPVERKEPRPGDVRRHCADVSLLRSLVDVRPQISMDDGLAATVAYYERRLGAARA
ncbi:MAG TPA: NAD-dependent epimerase/dehydratase family protein [Ktedonobacterales bacterium]